MKTSSQASTRLLFAGGDWVFAELPGLDRALSAFVEEARAAGAERARLMLEALEGLDTGGAWLLLRTRRALEAAGVDVELLDVSPKHARLLEAVERAAPQPAHPVERPRPLVRLLCKVGESVFRAANEAASLLSFLGLIVTAMLRAAARPHRFPVTAFVKHVENNGVAAIPIVALLSFLIGVVLAFQSAEQLRQFGAELFTIDLLGIMVFRELGVLLAAIILAGRSGSAFTAQIGAMKVSEEIDAMRVIGLDPLHHLVLPRVLALTVSLPLLAFLGSVMALIGGAAVLVLGFGIPLVQYLSQLREAVGLEMFLAGLVKAPVFAFLIAMIGCYEGLRVEGSAESVGTQTTRAVVVSIFAVIVVDAVFSILFQGFGI